MDESKSKSIWSDLNLATKGIYDPQEQKQNIDEDFTALYRNYNIEFKDEDLQMQFIKQNWKLQCPDYLRNIGMHLEMMRYVPQFSFIYRKIANKL